MDVYDLQARLDAAVAAEDYGVAARLRDVISERMLDVRSAVEFTNRQFYNAFQNADLTQMRVLWSRGSHVHCIHPLTGCIVGYDNVIESWETVFSSIPRGNFRITLDDVLLHVADNLAYVTCVEKVYSGREIGRIQATNVFERTPYSGWTIIHHHSSPLM